MAKLLQTLIPILFLLAAAANRARSQTTSFNYNFHGEKPGDLILQGNASFPSATTYLRLTDPKANQIGRALHSIPIQFRKNQHQIDFQTTINFLITPEPASTAAADGIAFFIGPVGSTIPYNSTGKDLGVFPPDGPNNVFAVEFATYVNGQKPDPNYPRIGINIGSATSSASAVVSDAIIGSQVTAKISYDPSTTMIEVILTAGGDTHDLSYVYDLSQLLDQEVQVGLSASTGKNFAKHEIVSWSFYSHMNYDAVIQKCVM